MNSFSCRQDSWHLEQLCAQIEKRALMKLKLLGEYIILGRVDARVFFVFPLFKKLITTRFSSEKLHLI